MVTFNTQNVLSVRCLHIANGRETNDEEKKSIEIDVIEHESTLFPLIPKLPV